MEQRITRAKARIADAGVPFEAPGAAERAERLGVVAAMIYLRVQRGLFGAERRGDDARARWPRKAIWLVRLLLRALPAASRRSWGWPP